MEAGELIEQHGARRQHRAHHLAEPRLVANQFANLLFERTLAHFSDLQPEGLERAADLVLNIDHLALRGLAVGQQQSELRGSRGS